MARRGQASAAQSVFFRFFSRTDLRIGLSKAKFDVEVDFEVNLRPAPPKPHQNRETRKFRSSFPKVSKNVRARPNASKRVRTRPNVSRRVPTCRNASKNVEKRRKTTKHWGKLGENLAKTARRKNKKNDESLTKTWRKPRENLARKSREGLFNYLFLNMGIC